MHIETLKVFCDVVETGSFSVAASQNFITQSAVSQALRGLAEQPVRVLLLAPGALLVLGYLAASQLRFRRMKQATCAVVRCRRMTSPPLLSLLVEVLPSMAVNVVPTSVAVSTMPMWAGLPSFCQSNATRSPARGRATVFPLAFAHVTHEGTYALRLGHGPV